MSHIFEELKVCAVCAILKGPKMSHIYEELKVCAVCANF